MASSASRWPNLVLCQSKAVAHLFTRIRNANTDNIQFAQYARRLLRVICEEGLASLPAAPVTVLTPTGSEFAGEHVDEDNLAAVSILRAGDSMLDTLLQCVPSATVGKILIQRDEETAQPKLFYSKLPPTIATKQVLLLDPMLATGGSANCAIQVLIDHGVPEANITFINVVACPEGLDALTSAYPAVRVVTAAVDECLNDKKYIVPGLGDFGDRFFGTTSA